MSQRDKEYQATLVPAIFSQQVNVKAVPVQVAPVSNFSAVTKSATLGILLFTDADLFEHWSLLERKYTNEYTAPCLSWCKQDVDLG